MSKLEPKKQIDWEGVEREYRAGQLSLSEIGEQYGLTKGRVSQVAKQKKWDRDLSLRIKYKAETKLQESLVNEKLNAKQKALTDADRVEAGAEAVTKIVLAHRQDIAALRSQARKYKEELDVCTDDLMKRTNILKMLTDTQKTLIAVEREAFNMDRGIDKSKSLGEFLESL